MQATAKGKGKAKVALPEVKAHYDVANGNLVLKFTNKGDRNARLSVADNAYGAKVKPVIVPAGETVEEKWVLASSHHWYDLTVTDNDDDSYQRRLAGHIETGKPSITDPAAVAPVMTGW
jgi:phospholipase C